MYFTTNLNHPNQIPTILQLICFDLQPLRKKVEILCREEYNQNKASCQVQQRNYWDKFDREEGA